MHTALLAIERALSFDAQKLPAWFCNGFCHFSQHSGVLRTQLLFCWCRHDSALAPQFHKGLVLKHNVNQRYATNAVSAALFRYTAAAQIAVLIWYTLYLPSFRHSSTPGWLAAALIICWQITGK